MVELLLQTSLNAIYAASFMALVAVGLVLIFGVMGIINFAHGELYMLGAYTVVAIYADASLPFFLAVAAGLIFVGLVGIGMERGLFRPMRDNPFGGLVVSIGFLLILQALAVATFGLRMEHIPPPTREVITMFGPDGVVMPVAAALCYRGRGRLAHRRSGSFCGELASAGPCGPAPKTPRPPRCRAFR